MSEIIKADICVIGAGSGGLSVAAGASQMGARTVLIERGKMGGDCLNYGCVPSKALLAAAHAAAAVPAAGAFGVNAPAPEIDFARVHGHVHEVIAGIAPHDSAERFEGLGVTVLRDSARFVDRRRVQAGDTMVQARRVVVATGSSPMVPPIEGLDRAPYLTNETIFDLRQRPEHLIVIGAGPIGLELAQAYRRLGARVTVLEAFGALAKDDPELAAVVLERLRGEGIAIRERVHIDEVSPGEAGIRVRLGGGAAESIEGSHLLVAAGRTANVQGLDLEAAGIEHTPKGIRVDRRLRTTNKHVYAAGDVAGGYQFTHVAGYHAGIVIRNALFRLPARVDYRAVPWVTYTDPELAQAGPTETQARETHGEVRVLRGSFEENDRARAERLTEGGIKVITGGRGRILGATIAGARAGELIQPWVLAIEQGLKIGALAGSIVPYPTLGEAGKRAAGSYYTATLFGRRTRLLVRFLGLFG